MRIIASMTTIPSRIDHIRPVIDAVLGQTTAVDRIEINIPYFCIRTGEDYEIPTWLQDLDKLEIFRTPDFGPITKVAPTLLRYKKDTHIYIWSVDDDIFYEPYELRLLCECNQPEVRRIVTRQAIFFDGNGVLKGIYGVGAVSMLAGFGGVLYLPTALTKTLKPT